MWRCSGGGRTRSGLDSERKLLVFWLVLSYFDWSGLAYQLSWRCTHSSVKMIWTIGGWTRGHHVTLPTAPAVSLAVSFLKHNLGDTLCTVYKCDKNIPRKVSEATHEIDDQDKIILDIRSDSLQRPPSPPCLTSKNEILPNYRQPGHPNCTSEEDKQRDHSNQEFRRKDIENKNPNHYRVARVEFDLDFPHSPMIATLALSWYKFEETKQSSTPRPSTDQGFKKNKK